MIFSCSLTVILSCRKPASHLTPSLAARDNQAMLPRIAPINPTRIAAPFDHADWFFELKHDGFRALAYIEDGSCKLISRKQII
jgi:ATP-dependent DNA ligase